MAFVVSLIPVRIIHLYFKIIFMKKTLNLSTRLLVMSFIGAMVLTSCKKDESLSPTTENDPVEVAATQNITAQDAESEAQFDDVFNPLNSVISAPATKAFGPAPVMIAD